VTREETVADTLQPERIAATHKSKWRLAGFIVGGILFAVVSVLVTVVLLAFHVPPAPAVQFDSLSAQKLEEAFRQATIAAQTGTPTVVRADETQINSKLEQLLRQQRTSGKNEGIQALKDVRIKLLGDRIEAYVLLDYNGRKLVFQLTGKVHTENGYVQFYPESGALGALPFPKSRIQAATAHMAEMPDDPLRYRLPSNMSDIRVEDGKVVFIVK